MDAIHRYYKLRRYDRLGYLHLDRILGVPYEKRRRWEEINREDQSISY